MFSSSGVESLWCFLGLVKEGTIYLRDCCVHFYFARVLLDALSVPPLGQVFYAPRVPPRRRSRKFSRKFVKKSYFANFSDAPDARGHRELPVVKISALNDPWRYQKRQKNETTKSDFFTISEFGFSSFSVDFGGARRFLTSKSDSLTNFAPGTQLLRSVRLLELSFVVRSFKKLGKF